MRLVDSTRFAAALAQASKDLASLHECQQCCGSGEIDVQHRHLATPETCPRCHGTGRWDEREPLARMVVALAEPSEGESK